jgi:hypothetical protein
MPKREWAWVGVLGRLVWYGVKEVVEVHKRRGQRELKRLAGIATARNKSNGHPQKKLVA